MMLMFPFMALLCTVITSIFLFIYVSIQLLKVFKNLVQDLFIWTRYFFFLLIYNVHCFLEHIFLPILYFIWWINLCVCCAKECHQKKATILTLKTSKSRRVVPYKKSLCLWSSYQVEGCFIHLSPLQSFTTPVVSKSKLSCDSALSYKTLYKTKLSRVPRRGPSKDFVDHVSFVSIFVTNHQSHSQSNKI